MKTYSKYGIILIIGVILGYFFFGRNEGASHEHEHQVAENNEDNTMWTCSMHPQIMQPEEGDCPICGMDLIPASATADGLAPEQFKMTKNAIALANIETITVGANTSENNKLQLSGKIVANKNANQIQTAHYDGRIEQLFVKVEGEVVRKGQLLAKVYAPELVAAQQELFSAKTFKKTQPELYKAVRNKLKNWKLSDSQIDKIEASEITIESLPIYANISGIVTAIPVEDGGHIKRGMPLFKITNFKTVWAELDVYEQRLSEIKIGQKALIKTNAYTDKEFESAISFIDPMVNTQTRIAKARVVLQNPKELLKPGMFVTADLEEGKKNDKVNEITIPKSTVLWTGKRSVVYVKVSNEEAIFEMREVTLGQAMGDKYEIIKGLKQGEEIVSQGTFTVDAAAQLQGKKSMMHQEEKMMESDMGEIVVTKEMKRVLPKLIKSYIAIKDALVESDTEKATMSAKEFKNLLEENQKLVEQYQMLFNTVSAINNVDIKVEEQREHFRMLSKNMIHILSAAGSMKETVYIQHCPMANQNKGANWISLEKNIQNPYFGEAMLTCGSVVDEL